MKLDIHQIREDSPSCKDKLFVNSAGASLMPLVVRNSIEEYLKEEEQLGGYKLAEIKSADIAAFYEETAKLIQAKPHQIAFAFSATEAYAKALSSIAFQEGDVILCSKDDYVSNQINFLSLQQRYKVEIVRVENLENGDLNLNDLETKIQRYSPRLVSLTHVPTNSGLVQDAVSVGKICQKYDVLYLLDACQSVGQLVVDVSEIQCDFLSCTGRKF